jgi:glycolate oxidase FAD binding subunit
MQVGDSVTILEPRDVAEVSAIMARANRDGQPVIPVGRSAGLSDPAKFENSILLSLEHLSTPIDHCAGDLTATVPAGATLGDVNARLRAGGQWLPLDPPYGERATIGGLVARNDSGPRRHRHGSPRDLIIGIEMVLADGRLAKAGGRVVKNVAGYDLARLMCGSRGSLAVIVGATFKLAPLAPASCTLIADFDEAGRALAAAQRIAAAPVTPAALEVAIPENRLLVRFETTPVAAEQQAGAAAQLAVEAGGIIAIRSGAEEEGVWSDYVRLWDQPGTLVKAAVLPTEIPATLASLREAAERVGVTFRAGGRAALGVLYVLLEGAAEGHAEVLEDLRRAARQRGGHAVVERAGTAVLNAVNRWGDLGDAVTLQRAVKQQFDPNGILKPRAGPGGL